MKLNLITFALLVIFFANPIFSREDSSYLTPAIPTEFDTVLFVCKGIVPETYTKEEKMIRTDSLFYLTLNLIQTGSLRESEYFTTFILGRLQRGHYLVVKNINYFRGWHDDTGFVSEDTAYYVIEDALLLTISPPVSIKESNFGFIKKTYLSGQ